MVCSGMRGLMTVLLMIGVTFVDGGGKHYNNAEHDLLCDVLKAAVGLWQNRENRNGLLGRALAQTIFGTRDRVEDVTNIKFPSVYTSPDYRLDWCGDCDDPSGPYPGRSISHDLICLCTVGGGGAPFNFGAETLCGKKQGDLVCEGCTEPFHLAGGRDHGWDGNQSGKQQLQNTWNKIVLACLTNGTNGNLKAALDNFTSSLGGKKQLGGQGGNCGGDNAVNICVNYTNCEGVVGYPMWWKKLREALMSEESKAATSSVGSTSGPAAGRKSTGTSMNSGTRSNAGKGYDGEGTHEDSTTKNSPDTDSQSLIASESSKHSRETSNGEGGNFGFFRLLGTFKLSQLNWFLFSGLL